MAIVDVTALTYGYHGVDALRGIDLTVPEGSLCALLGPNGAGKTTLVQVMAGLRRPRSGRAVVMGIDSTSLSARDRERIGYMAEGQSLPDWMRVAELERYLAPLYPTWDTALARSLRERFDLDPNRRIRTFSRGERVKAALLCALAPRPRLLLMDEPFSGMDAIVKDELVRGLLESAGSDGWTVLLASHDIGELELLADRVGILVAGRVSLAATMDDVRARFKHVEVTTLGSATLDRAPAGWMSFEQAERRVAFVADERDDARLSAQLASHFPGARVDVRSATLREVFVAIASPRRPESLALEVAA